jgi:hypothetical protein
VRAGSGGVGSAFTAQYTTRQRYAIGIFKTTIMKTNSQTSIRRVYEMLLRPGLQGRPAAPPQHRS